MRLFFCLLISCACLLSAKAQYLYPNSPANDFSLFIEQDLSLKNARCSGAVALGGNLYLDGKSSLAYGNSGHFFDASQSTPVGLLIGRGLFFKDSANLLMPDQALVKIGKPGNLQVQQVQEHCPEQYTRISSGPDAASSPFIRLQKDQTAADIFRPGILDFQQRFQQLTAISAGLAACPENVDIKEQSAGADLTLRLHPGVVNVWNTSVSFLNAHPLIELSPAPNVITPLIINVIGDNTKQELRAPVLAGMPQTNAIYVLWNIRQIPALSMQTSGTFSGTLFAPACDLAILGSGQLESQVIARSLYLETGTFNDRIFAAPVAVCQPEISTAESTPQATKETYSIALFPNPTSDELRISSSGALPVSVRIYNTQGQLIRMIRLDGAAFSVQDLPADYYFAELLDEADATLKVLGFQKVN